jgi:hypothetical protein
MVDWNAIQTFFAVTNLLFIIFGTIGNMLTFLVLLRKSIFKHSCMRYLATLCILDTLCLYTWNFSSVYQELFTGRKIEFEGAIICRLFSFFSYFILQASSWIMCLIGADRIVTVVWKGSSGLFSAAVKNSLLVSAITIAFLFCFNFVVIIINAEPYIQPVASNETSKISKNKSANISSNTDTLPRRRSRTYSCYEPKEFYLYWDIIQTIMYGFIPFLIILIENVTLSCLTLKHDKRMSVHTKAANQINSSSTISDKPKHFPCIFHLSNLFNKRNASNTDSAAPIIDAKKKDAHSVLENSIKRSKRVHSKGSHVANLMLFLTVSFFLTSVPYSLFYALRLNFIITNQNAKNLAIGALTVLKYARHSFNFLIYLSTSSLIKSEVELVIRELQKKIFR